MGQRFRGFFSFLIFSSSSFAVSPVPLVFIHGIKGSTLVDGRGNVHWLTAMQAMGFGPNGLALPLSWTDRLQPTDDLKPSEILNSVSIIPLLVEEKVYGPWMKIARGMGRPFYPFVYDWRRDLLETVDQFELFLREVRAKNGNQPVQVVAHSLGGLITLAILNQHPELFRHVVFVGVPFQGGLGFLPDLHAGRSVGINRKILSSDVLATFPSVYALLPPTSQNFVSVSGEVNPIVFHNFSSWKSHRLTYFATGCERPPQFEGFLGRVLSRVKEFREKLIPQNHWYPPVMVVVGKGTPTLKTVIIDGPSAERGLDFTTAPLSSGDGRVLENEALPPSGLIYQTTSSNKEHAALLNDPEVAVQISLMGN